jgi:hypothetical protein
VCDRKKAAGKEGVSRWVLTKREKSVILFVVIAFLLGLAVKVYRDHHPPAERPQNRSHALVPRHRTAITCEVNISQVIPLPQTVIENLGGVIDEIIYAINPQKALSDKPPRHILPSPQSSS